MALFDWLFPQRAAVSAPTPQGIVGVQAEVLGFNDPRFLEFIRTGQLGVDQTLKNATVLRCVTLIASSIAMLPIYVRNRQTRLPVEEHALYDVLNDRPNGWQTPAEFKQLMQLRLLLTGNAYAHKVMSGSRVVALVPLDPASVTVVQNSDFSLSYTYQPKDGLGCREMRSDDVIHLRALSRDGIVGLSVVEQAAEAIELAKSADLSASRSFAQGITAGGALATSNKLSPEARDNIRKSLEARYSGPENAGKWMVLEEGLKPEKFAETSVDLQQLETRRHQVEEIGRVFGVPRPFLGVDDTSWGSGIEQLRLMLVSGALAPWFTVWEQALANKCLTREERRRLYVDFDERELLRGSMKDQAEYLAKASGSGGFTPWMTPNEIRDYVGLGPIEGGDKLEKPAQQQGGAIP